MLGDALASRAVYHHAGHAVPGEQRAHRVFEPGRLDRAAVELGVEVGGDPAQLLAFVAADPQRVLERVEVEIRRVVDDLRGGLDGVGALGEFPPRGERWPLGEIGEARHHSRALEFARHAHHGYRVHSGRDQVGPLVERVGRNTEQRGNRRAQVQLGHRGASWASSSRSIRSSSAVVCCAGKK